MLKQERFLIKDASRPAKSNPGVFIDIDGVVLKGGKPFEWSSQALNLLWENDVPFVFVTNGTYSSRKLVSKLTSIFELPFTDDHVVVAPSPCKGLFEFHDKHVLVCCQDDSIDLITELGFVDYLTLDELANTFPELDYVDHRRRDVLMSTPLTEEQKKKQAEFRPIEAIVLLGEPINWECALQVLIDVLMTNGDPRSKFKYVPSPHLPIIAANKDMTFKGLAALPRFGHGAFLECFESLYSRITNNELVYECIMGKPYLITYEYASNQIQRLSKSGERVNKFFMIGDNPEVDIRGANVFKESMCEETTSRSSRTSRRASSIADYLGIPRQNSQVSLFGAQPTGYFKPVEGILVCTGVYNPQNDYLFHLRTLFNQSMLLESPPANNPPPNTSNNNNEDEDNESGVADLSIVVSDTSGSTTTPTAVADASNSSLGSLSSTSHNNNSNNKIKSASSFVLRDPTAVNELQEALSRRNSFINYFDNKLNVPDVTVPNLLDAVNYIIQSIRK